MVEYNELIKNVNILLVDDDDDYLSVTDAYLRLRGYNVDTAKDGMEALEKMDNKNYHILLVDYYMPSMSGEELINKVRQNNKEIIIILQTGFAGQKPPIESMEKLNIQNYHDKSEGIDKLNLELMSAVKIFNQQNEIELTKYRSIAIGNLMSSIASEIRASLLSISAGIEYTNMIMQDSAEQKIDEEKIVQINKFYKNNKEYLEKIDKILSAIINQSNVDNNDDVVRDEDTIEIINLILKSTLRSKNIMLDTKIVLKTGSYITGCVDDVIFVICEIVRKLVNIMGQGQKINLTLSEDEDNWYYKIESEYISKLDKRNVYLIKGIVTAIKDITIYDEPNIIGIAMKKR